MKHILYDVGKVLCSSWSEKRGVTLLLLVYFMCRFIPRCWKAFWGLFHLISYPQNLKLYPLLLTMNSYSFLGRMRYSGGKKQLDFKICFKACRSQKNIKNVHPLSCLNFSKLGQCWKFIRFFMAPLFLSLLQQNSSRNEHLHLRLHFYNIYQYYY